MQPTTKATRSGPRLLMVTANFPPQCGGVQVYSYELAVRFAALCEEVAVVAPMARRSASIDRRLPFRVHRVPALGDNLALSAIPTLARVARRYDVVFATHWSAGFAALVAAPHARVVVAAHGKEVLSDPFHGVPVLNDVALRIQRHVYARAHGFVAVSRFTAGLLEDATVGNERITWVSNGVDVDRFSPSDRDRARASRGLRGKPIVLTVCRLVPRKGVDRVIALLPALAQRWPEIACVVVGDGPERRRLEELAARLGVSRRVVWAGEVDYVRGPIVDYFNACDVFVLPATSEVPDVEGFGLVYLEANACAKPVVGLRDGGVTDAVVDGVTGLLVEPGSPSGLADAVRALLEDPARARRMGEAGRARVARDLTWDATARRIVDEALARR